MNKKDITGQKFGKLTAVKFSHKDDKKVYWWIFKCDCGTIKTITRRNVINKSVKSCGCMWHASGKDSPHTTHGISKTKFYCAYIHITQRCKNKKVRNYKDYGGRGIKCLWKSSDEFYNDMYKSYIEHIKKFGEKQTTIDRIDNNGNYCKENCRWATPKIQQRNKRNSLLITYKGQTCTLPEWSEKLNLKLRVLYKRYQMGYPTEKIFQKL